MGNVLRRVRGAIGMGITWAAAWSVVGGVPRWVFGIPSELPFPILFGGLGFVAGVTFSGLLMLTEGRRRFDQMSLPRFSGWGALGGLLMAALFVRGAGYGLMETVAISGTFVVASAASAAGSLAIARRAMKRELSAGGEDAPGELSGAENQKLR